jgi:membrane protease YdiL (CAAX protease family)
VQPLPEHPPRFLWLRAGLAAAAALAAVAMAGVKGAQLVRPVAFLWVVASPLLAFALIELTVVVTAANTYRAAWVVARLLRRIHRLPASGEPFVWNLLVVAAEEALFRLAAFTWLPASAAWVCAVSLAFTCLHLPRILGRKRPARVAAANFLLSVALSVAYLATRSYWLVLATHLLHNAALDRLRNALAAAERLRNDQQRRAVDEQP